MTETATPVVIEQTPVNPLMVRARIPGRTFALPSRGVFYTHGEVDDTVKDGEVLIYPMVTMDELAMKTPDKLLNGTALDEVIKRCIPQIQKPIELLATDVDFLMVALREITYGSDFEITYTHDCKDAKEHTYAVKLDSILSGSKKINVSKVENDYTLTLPNEQVVKLSPPRYMQMLDFYKSLDKNIEDVKPNEMVSTVIDTTAAVIESVDGITDKNMIREWLTAVPAGYVNQIGDRLSEVGEWGPKLTRKVKCKDCGTMMDVVIPLNPMSFFS